LGRDRSPDGGAVDRRAGGEERLGGFPLIPFQRSPKRRPAVLQGRVRVGAARQQGVDVAQVVLAKRRLQGAVSVRGRGLQVRAGCGEGGDDRSLVLPGVLDGQVDRAVAARIARIEVGAVGGEERDQVGEAVGGRAVEGALGGPLWAGAVGEQDLDGRGLSPAGGLEG
jgi:hypothetical protein